jgi:hypothetical protein
MYEIFLKYQMKHVIHLLGNSPLEHFYIHSQCLGSFFDSPGVEDEFWTQIILTHGKRLVRFSVDGTLISWETIHSICVQCTKLELLSVVVDPNNVVRRLACWKNSDSKYLLRRLNWVLVYLSQRH